MITITPIADIKRGDKIIIYDPSDIYKNYIVTVTHTDLTFDRERIYFEEKEIDIKEAYWIPESGMVVKTQGAFKIDDFSLMCIVKQSRFTIFKALVKSFFKS